MKEQGRGETCTPFPERHKEGGQMRGCSWEGLPLCSPRLPGKPHRACLPQWPSKPND